MAQKYANIDDACQPKAGEAVIACDLISIHADDGLAYKANAGVGADQDGPAIGVSETIKAIGEILEVKREGKIAGASGLTLGAWVYLAIADGGITQTAPSVTGDYLQVVGVAVSSTEWLLQIESHSVVP